MIDYSWQDMALAEQVKSLRVARGMTQGELGKIVGMLQSRISAIESGTQNLSLRTLRRIAAAFGANLIVGLEELTPGETYEREVPDIQHCPL